MALRQEDFEKFAKKVWWAHTRFCVCLHINNEIAKPNHYDLIRNDVLWHTMLPTLQQGWILALASIFDLPYYKKRTKQQPRLCLDHIVKQLNDPALLRLINDKKIQHQIAIESIRHHRQFIAHNPVDEIRDLKIEPVGNLFDDLEKIVISVGQNIEYGYFTNSLYNDTDEKARISAQKLFAAIHDYYSDKNQTAYTAAG